MVTDKVKELEDFMEATKRTSGGRFCDHQTSGQAASMPSEVVWRGQVWGALDHKREKRLKETELNQAILL